MPILGAHKSIAGGFAEAVKRAAQCGCDCLQLFTKNANRWRARDVTLQDADGFRTALADHRIGHTAAHDSYLINLASPEKALWYRSIEAVAEELRRADRLGIPYLVVHPGAYTTSTESSGLKRVIRAVDEIHRQTRGLATACLLETTAGQGTSLGWQFEHLASILDGVQEPDLMGICFDTCHVFAAGYPLATAAEYRSTMDRFDCLIGLERIRAFHLNDSGQPRGSRVDRHAHIGRGEMGLRPFRRLLRDGRFRAIPMYLETPKGKQAGVDWDSVNLQTLRDLAGRQPKNKRAADPG